MTAYNQYATTQLQNRTYGNSQLQEPFVHVVTFEKPTDTDNGSIFRLGKFPTSLIPYRVTVKCDALSGATATSLGAYKADGGDVINKNLLMTAQTLASASKVLDGAANVDIALLGTSTLAELLGYTAANAPSEVDLALTLDTAGSAAGTITVEFHFKRR